MSQFSAISHFHEETVAPPKRLVLEPISSNPPGRSGVLSQSHMLRGGALNFSAWCMIGFTSHHVSASSHRSPLCAAQHEQSAAYKTEMHDLLSLKAINPALGEASPIDCRLPFVRFDFRTHFSNFLKTALCIGSGESMTPERKRRTTSKTRRKTKLQNSNAHKEMFPSTQQTNE